jgi:hypothetical protein
MKSFSHLLLGMALFSAPLAKTNAAPSKQSTPTPATASATNAVSFESVFTMPASPKEGRDPFFPNSTSVYNRGDVKPKPSTITTVFTLNGVSGTANRRLAIINGRTLAEGEETEINTSSGRIRVRCIEITTSSAVIEVDGVRRELHLRID